MIIPSVVYILYLKPIEVVALTKYVEDNPLVTVCHHGHNMCIVVKPHMYVLGNQIHQTIAWDLT